MLPLAVFALWGALWIALVAFAYAIFALLAAPLGVAGAAAATGGIFLVVAGLIGLVVRARIAAMKRGALMAGLAGGTGAANAVLGFVGKRPLVSLGVAGTLAALLFARGGVK